MRSVEFHAAEIEALRLGDMDRSRRLRVLRLWAMGRERGGIAGEQLKREARGDTINH